MQRLSYIYKCIYSLRGGINVFYNKGVQKLQLHNTEKCLHKNLKTKYTYVAKGNFR